MKLLDEDIKKIVTRSTQDFCLQHPQVFDEEHIETLAELAGEQLHLSEKSSKLNMKRAVIQSIRSFSKQYPEAFNNNYTESLAKRIAGQLYTHFIHNPRHNGRDNWKR